MRYIELFVGGAESFYRVNDFLALVIVVQVGDRGFSELVQTAVQFEDKECQWPGPLTRCRLAVWGQR